MVLDNTPVPGRPTNLDNRKARATAIATDASEGCFFLSSFISLFFLLLSGRRPDID